MASLKFSSSFHISYCRSLLQLLLFFVFLSQWGRNSAVNEVLLPPRYPTQKFTKNLMLQLYGELNIRRFLTSACVTYINVYKWRHYIKIIASFYLSAFMALNVSFLTFRKVKDSTLWCGRFIDCMQKQITYRDLYKISNPFIY